MKMNKFSVLAVVFTLIAFAGCIMTATVIVTSKLAPDADGSSIRFSHLTYSDGKMVVNLNSDSDFEEYKDNIKNIDNIGFYLEVSNYEFSDATFQLFLEPDTTKEWTTPYMPADSNSSLLFFTGLTIPKRPSGALTGKTIVTWEESIEYLSDLESIKPFLEKGVFSIYPNIVPRDDFDISIDSLVIIITLTGQK
ncbi:MAG: hypothetical protein KAR42_11805 [candidate division Zixibacteria bacterium]|nr:hypothetical protein [candidate division Zixibacteria bacterium]